MISQVALSSCTVRTNNRFHWPLAHPVVALSPPMAHLDVKSPNILLASKDYHNVCAKLTDFGTSVQVTNVIHGKFVMNPMWLAPEVQKKLIRVTHLLRFSLTTNKVQVMIIDLMYILLPSLYGN
jgi:serine/threonine protein kinase